MRRQMGRNGRRCGRGRRVLLKKVDGLQLAIVQDLKVLLLQMKRRLAVFGDDDVDEYGVSLCLKDGRLLCGTGRAILCSGSMEER